MKILWTENPLETRVELDDADRLLLRERIRVEYLKDLIYNAYFTLKPLEGAEIPDRERIERAFLALDVYYVFDDETRDGKSFDVYLDEQLAYYTAALTEKHCGDCTCVPASCSKCYAESLLGIDTIRGLGKHSAYKIDSAFAGGASIDEAVERLANYQPKYDPNSKWPREDWEKHVPRWVEEGKRAHAWLVAYRDEHFGGVR